MKSAGEVSCLQSLFFTYFLTLFSSTVPPGVPLLLSVKLSGNGMLEFIHIEGEKKKSNIQKFFSGVAQGSVEAAAG